MQLKRFIPSVLVLVVGFIITIISIHYGAKDQYKHIITDDVVIAIVVISSSLALFFIPNVIAVGGSLFKIDKYLTNEYVRDEYTNKQLSEATKDHNEDEYIELTKTPYENTVRVFYNGLLQSSNFVRINGKKIYCTEYKWSELAQPSSGGQVNPDDNTITIEYINQ